MRVDAASAQRRVGAYRRMATLSMPLVFAGWLTTSLAADDWNNLGGNSARNGRSAEVGPISDQHLLWDNLDRFSIISWHPVTLGQRVFAIRESGFPGAAANDRLVAYDLDTGDELWDIQVPYGGDSSQEWIAYVGGARDGKVYCARGGSGRTTPVYAFDATNGGLLWGSVVETVAGPQSGFVFAPNGDLIVGDFDAISRIDAGDGSTVWSTPRNCPVSGNCGAAANTHSAYIDEVAAGGQVITRYDLATGAALYSSPVMAGFTAQNAPFLSPGGEKVFYARSQNNAAVDRLYAFRDDGTQFVPLWDRPVRWTTSHEHGIGPDGSIYSFDPNDTLVRLDPNEGAVIDRSGVLSPLGSPNLSARTAVDAAGTVYISNGWASNPATDGRVWAFSPDLSQVLFTLTLDRQSSGGPCLGAKGTLIVADRQGVYAYRTPCLGDLDGDRDRDLTDLALLLADFDCSGGGCSGDVDDDGDTDLTDLALRLSVFEVSCP